MLKVSRLFGAALLVLGAQAAHASTQHYAATSYSPGGHSLWIQGGLGAGFGSDFHFEPSGKFTTNGVDSATLTGRVVSEDDRSQGFFLSFSYDVSFDGVVPEYKKEGGAAAEPADNYFLNLAAGSLIGFGDDLEGLDLSATRRPELTSSADRFATQVGTGSNAKDPDEYGLANWLYFDVVRFQCLICSDAPGHLNEATVDAKYGDINIDLAPVPLPAGAVLMLSGLGALSFARRRRKARG